MGAITRLEALNMMLLYAGESIVTSEENDAGGTDISLATYILDQASRDFQMNGLANNKLVIEVEPDVNNEILLRADALTCNLVSYHVDQYGRSIRGVMRGTPPKLFNVTEQISTWTGSKYVLDYTLKVDWEELDTAAQQAVAIAAARVYQITIQGDAATDNFLAGKEQEAQLQAQREDTKARRMHITDTMSPMWRRSLTSSRFIDPTSYARYGV